MSNPKETVLGQYVVMPDGQLYQKMVDGSWIPSKERISSAESSITERFKDTVTVPNDWRPETDGAISRKHIDHLIKISPTHRHIHAHLIEMLGSPTDIIKNNKLPNRNDGKNIKSVPTLHRTAIKLIEALNCEPWNSVMPYLKD